MDELLIKRLRERNEIESRYGELFEVVSLAIIKHNSNDAVEKPDNSIVARLRKELKAKEIEINKLKEVVDVKNKDSERLNNEIISLTIENNLTSRRLTELEKEHEKLVKRWMAKVQEDVDRLNAHFV